jgi:ApbE superfamily uncharacterized protein (UPF0280 family)
VSRDVHLSAHRRYRETLAPQAGELTFQAVVEQSDLLVTAERDLSAEVLDHLRGIRGQLKAFVLLHPEFRTSLVPVEVPEGAADIVADMARSARACGVGPFAAVAGAVAQSVADRFAGVSPNILVENGGDLYLRSTRERVVSFLADPKSEARLGCVLAPDEFPVSFCASSGRIGPSLSLGVGDLVAVRANRGSLADAAATALGNLLHAPRDLRRVTDLAQELAEHGVEGVFAQFDDKIAVWGKIELTVIE